MHATKRSSQTVPRNITLHEICMQTVVGKFTTAESPGKGATGVNIRFHVDKKQPRQLCFQKDHLSNRGLCPAVVQQGWSGGVVKQASYDHIVIEAHPICNVL